MLGVYVCMCCVERASRGIKYRMAAVFSQNTAKRGQNVLQLCMCVVRGAKRRMIGRVNVPWKRPAVLHWCSSGTCVRTVFNRDLSLFGVENVHLASGRLHGRSRGGV